jgi:hypothetical protein
VWRIPKKLKIELPQNVAIQLLNTYPKELKAARHWWFTPVILATQEAEIRRITVLSQPRQTVHETLSQKYPSRTQTHTKRVSGVAQGGGLVFKPQYHTHTKKIQSST